MPQTRSSKMALSAPKLRVIRPNIQTLSGQNRTDKSWNIRETDSRDVDNEEKNLENELENFRIILRDHLAAGEDVVAKWEAICSRYAQFASGDSLLERLSRDDQESLHYIREQGRRIRSKKALILRDWNWSEDNLVETFPDVDSRERQVGVRGSNRSVPWKPWEVKKAIEHLKNQAEGRHLWEDQSEPRQARESPEQGRLQQTRGNKATHDSASTDETASPTPDTSASSPPREPASQRRNPPDESETSSDNAVEEVKATGKLTSIAKASLRVERRLSREVASPIAAKASARIPTRRTTGVSTKDDDGMAEPHKVAGLENDIKLQPKNNDTNPTPPKGQTRKRLPEDRDSDVGQGSSSTHNLPVRGAESTPSKKPRTSNDVPQGLKSPFTPAVPPKTTTTMTGLATPESTVVKPSIILRKRTVLSSNTETERTDVADGGLDDVLGSVDFEIPRNFHARLAPGAELDDGVIETCLDVFSSTTGLGCSVINPHLFKAGSTTRHASVQVAIARTETTKILVPLHLPDSHHWVLCCVLKGVKEIQVFDSLAKDNDEVHRLLYYALQNLYFEEYRITPRPCYQQVNGYDCGICLLVNAVHLMADLDPPLEANTMVWRNCFRALGDSTATPNLLTGIPYSRESFKVHLEFRSGSFTVDEFNALWVEKQSQFKAAIEEHQPALGKLTPEVQQVLEILEKVSKKLTGDERKKLLEQWDRESRHEDDTGGWMHGKGRAERRYLRRAKQRVLNALPRLEHAVRYLQTQLDHLALSKKELDGLELSLSGPQKP
ncbi:ulp1 protease family protein [Colletotrichum camelliae]|nr:ulp1 protease family protein [Colletotrichum camelliae]